MKTKEEIIKIVTKILRAYEAGANETEEAENFEQALDDILSEVEHDATAKTSRS